MSLQVSQWPLSWRFSPVGSLPCPASENSPGSIRSPFFRRLLTQGLKSQVGLPLFHSGNPCLLGPHLAAIRFLEASQPLLRCLACLIGSSVLGQYSRTLVSQVGIPQFQFAPPFGFLFPCPQPEQFDYRFPSLSGWGCCCQPDSPVPVQLGKMKSGPTIQRASFPSFFSSTFRKESVDSLLETLALEKKPLLEPDTLGSWKIAQGQGREL